MVLREKKRICRNKEFVIIPLSFAVMERGIYFFTKDIFKQTDIAGISVLAGTL